MTTSKRTLLVTGGAGVLGRPLLRELAPEYNLVALVRKSPVDPNVATTVTGDVTQPGLGLTAEGKDAVAGIDAVVHCAALTEFGADPVKANAINVSGTRRVLDFVAEREVPLFHVSTAFLNRKGDRVGEDGKHADAYLASKAESEGIVRECGLPVTILKPSVVVGDSRTGEISQFQGLHMIGRALFKGVLPVLPFSADTPVDCLPQDLVCRALATVLRQWRIGETLWITAGENSLTCKDIADVSVEFAAASGVRIDYPRLMGHDAFERLLVPLLHEILPPHFQKEVGRLLDWMPLFQDGPAYPSSLAEIDPELVPSHEMLVQTLKNNLDYMASFYGLLGRAAAA